MKKKKRKSKEVQQELAIKQKLNGISNSSNLKAKKTKKKKKESSDKKSPSKNSNLKSAESSETDSANKESDEDITFIEKQKILHKQVLFELIQTEEKYSNDLNIVINVYKKELSKLIKPDVEKKIFGNVSELKDLSEKLLSEFEGIVQIDLEKEMSRNEKNVGTIFIYYADFFKIYLMYCSNVHNQQKEIEGIKKKVAQFQNFFERMYEQSRM